MARGCVIPDHHRHDMTQNHKDVITQLSPLLDHKTLPQVLLFHGSQGVGQEQVIKNLAVQALGISDMSTPHLDLLVIDSVEDSIKKDQCVEIQNHLMVYPSRSDWRVVVIFDAHRFHVQSVQYLLKTLEEPPPYALVLMSTHKRHSLKPTLLSRAVSILIKPYNIHDFKRLVSDGYDRHHRSSKQAKPSLRVEWLDQLYDMTAGSVGQALYLLENQKMLSELQDILTARYSIWLLSEKVSSFLDRHPLTARELLTLIELSLSRMYRRDPALLAAHHQVSQRRKFLTTYHLACARHSPVLKPHLMLQGCVSTGA